MTSSLRDLISIFRPSTFPALAMAVGIGWLTWCQKPGYSNLIFGPGAVPRILRFDYGYQSG